ncbi:hypothetical protein TTHERM_00058940 (macronuclear) [Tetrahymena thermophila SB210]|uniref:Protein kinase domain-containing protein n=1 Tax=Tetrahymena thermophila (strain SB210) TaxID=312017 RepID=I7M6W4_TETTS|nr:hypothetical protein TTHERM_00058940 [Tetrahymena thermophila SB210]EAR87382.2 hypothetical protein TTHERM_00058940 [Tetrahymena thermophila SB210]|eukprot:XP_001007627.2 hypothetical protein TTHERM_00058940 [Tetrahymena thermophila SB210]
MTNQLSQSDSVYVIGNDFQKEEQEFVALLEDYIKFIRQSNCLFDEKLELNEQAQQIQQILLSQKCQDVQLVKVYYDKGIQIINIYFFRIVYGGKMYIIKVHKNDVLISHDEMKGIKNLKEIEIGLKIIKNISAHELINALQTQSSDSEMFSFILYETLSDMWLNLDRAAELKQIIQQYCQQVIPIGINNNNNNISRGENSYFFSIKYEDRFYILKAVQKSHSDANDYLQIQYNLLKQQIQKQGNNKDLHSQILQIIDNHPLYKDLIQHKDYQFVIFEYFICNISDLLIYQNDIQKMYKQQNQRRIPSIIIARIMVEIFKIIKNIKNQKIKIQFFNLNNIYLTQHISVAQKISIEIKIGNFTCVDKQFNLNQQVNIINCAFNHSLSQNEQQQIKDYNLAQLIESQNRNNRHFYSIDQNEQEDDYELIVSQDKVIPGKIQVLEKGIIHQINASVFIQQEEQANELSSNYDDSQQESSFEESKSNFEQSNSNYENRNQFYLNNRSSESINNSKSQTMSTHTNRLTKEKTLNYSNILKQLFNVVKNCEAFKINSSLQLAYEQSEEFAEIKSIILQNNYINVKFVKLGQNSKHFFCQSSFQERDYYVKVYNKNKQHILTDKFISNQIEASKNINWNNQSINCLNQFQQTQIQEKYLSNSDSQATGLGETYKYLLNPNHEISQGNFRIFVYEKCLCNLREILPYIQPGQLIFPKNQNNEYTIYDLLKQISMQIVFIFKCIHESDYVHMDFDLTKFLIDTKGNIKISNFQLCQQPKQIKVEFAKCYNQIYKKIFHRLFDLNEIYVDKEIQIGKYNSKIILADFFMLGFTLIELFLCLDNRKFTERILNIQNNSDVKSKIEDSAEILKIKLLNPKIQFIFDQEFQIQINDPQEQQPLFELSQQQKQLIEIALDLMSLSEDKCANDLLNQLLKKLEKN